MKASSPSPRATAPTRRPSRTAATAAVVKVTPAIAALAARSGHEPFTPAVTAAAATLTGIPDLASRRDLRDLVTFTIDGEHTRDFDDALSARREGDNVRVWVHVADVAAYVRPGDPVDTQARKRATSVYLPTMTVPMLPAALSNGICSLMAGTDRAAVTCELLLRDGRVLSRALYRSVIHSDARLTYTHVDDIFEGRATAHTVYAAALRAAREAAQDRGSLTADERDGDVEFELDGDEVVAVHERPGSESHRLIEALMVLANEQVAMFLHERGAPALYRSHAGPDRERVAKVLARVRSLGVHVGCGTLQGARDALAARSEQVRSVLWGAQEAAQYQRERNPHDGLQLDSYTHFTSPIRRYADLVVHRALLAELGLEAHDTTVPYQQLPELAEHLVERSRASKKLERAAGDICRASLLARRLRTGELAKRARGTVSGVGPAGVYVSVDCAQGMLSGRDLGGVPNAELTMWKGAAGTVTLGDELDVRIAAVDVARGRIRLALGAKNAGRSARPAPKTAPAARPVRRRRAAA